MRKFYRYYFEQLAMQDQQILHDPAGATAFYSVKEKYDLEAFDNAIKSVGKTPALILEPYFYDGSDRGSRNYFKMISGRFSVLTKAEAGNQQSIDDAVDLCEEIADDLLAKMREDLLEGDVITIDEDNVSKKVWFPWENIKVDPIGPVSAYYYGVSVGFTWKTPAQALKTPENWVAQG